MDIAKVPMGMSLVLLIAVGILLMILWNFQDRKSTRLNSSH